MIYLFAGHHYDEAGADPGAIGVNGIKEADLTIEFCDLVAAELDDLKAKYIRDDKADTLRELLRKIKPGSGSVLCEVHFNSADRLATGTEVLVSDKAGIDSRRLAQELCNAQAKHLGLINRGVKTEKQSKRGKIAILNTPAGISVLTELCFINNPSDVEQYHKGKNILAYIYAQKLLMFDRLYN